jgi:hypothetical protein
MYVNIYKVFLFYFKDNLFFNKENFLKIFNFHDKTNKLINTILKL